MMIHLLFFAIFLSTSMVRASQTLPTRLKVNNITSKIATLHVEFNKLTDHNMDLATDWEELVEPGNTFEFYLPGRTIQNIGFSVGSLRTKSLVFDAREKQELAFDLTMDHNEVPMLTEIPSEDNAV